MVGYRQRRIRVLEALERRAKGFRTDEDLYPLRVPPEPLALGAIVEQALSDDGGRYDPLELRSRTLLRLEWSDGSVWEAWVLMLPSGLKLFCDAGGDDTHVLASGGRHASDETDRQFLQALADSAGERFGIEMSGGAPSHVSCSITDREFLVDLFTTLFELSGAEASVREQLASTRSPTTEPTEGTDFRNDVRAWLDRAMR